MATGIDTYQRLALSDAAALRLRKHASRRLLAFEQAYDERRAETLLVLGCMRDESGTPRRDAARGTVNATSDALPASDRPSVPDSFDARPGSQRAAERPYSESQFKRDVRTGRSPAAQCGVCLTLSVPTWAVSLSHDERAKLATSPRVFAEPSDESSEREPSIRQRANDERADRAARLRDVAGVIRMAEQD